MADQIEDSEQNVLDFFGMSGLEKLQTLSRLIAIGFAVSSFGSLIAWVASW